MQTPDFGAVAPVYDEVRPLDANRLELFDALIREGGLLGYSVLDVGCGTGQLSLELTRRGVHVRGVDVSPEMLEVARTKLPNPVFALASAERLPFEDGSFDRVGVLCVVHLVGRPAAFAEARRVLAPGGRHVIATFRPCHFERYYLNACFPSMARIDRERFPDERTLRSELGRAGLARVRAIHLHQEATLERATVLERVRSRHISTLQLLDEDEYAAGLALSERDLPESVDQTADFVILLCAP